ncbi:MAG: CsgG/HfaB family protein [Spirochaetota bacterium]
MKNLVIIFLAIVAVSCSSVSYKPLPYKDRILVAVGEVDNQTGNHLFDSVVSESTGNYIHHFHKTQCFRVIERHRLSELLKEHRLSMTGLIDQSQGKRIGKILGVDAILYLALSSAKYNKNEQKAGSAISIEEKLSITVDARLVTVETGEILASAVFTTVEEAKVQAIGKGLSRGEPMDQLKAVREVVTVKAPEYIADQMASQVYKMSLVK